MAGTVDPHTMLAACNIDPLHPDAQAQLMQAMRQLLQSGEKEKAQLLQRAFNQVRQGAVPVATTPLSLPAVPPAPPAPVPEPEPEPAPKPVPEELEALVVLPPPPPGADYYRGKVAFINHNINIKPDGPVQGEAVKLISCPARMYPAIVAGMTVDFEAGRGRTGRLEVRALRAAQGGRVLAGNLEAFPQFDKEAHSWCMLKLREEMANPVAAARLFNEIVQRMEQERARNSQFIHKSYGNFIVFLQFLYNEIMPHLPVEDIRASAERLYCLVFDVLESRQRDKLQDFHRFRV